MKIDLGTMNIARVLLEVRFDNAYLIWDRAGQLWSAATKRWPTIENQEAQPGQILFIHPEKFKFETRLERCSIAAYSPNRTLSTFTEYADEFISLVIETLEIIEFTRIGFRIIFHQEYDSREESTASVAELRAINASPGPHFSKDERPVEINYLYRLEGEVTGTTVRVKSVRKNLDVAIPFDISFMGAESISKSMHLVEIDIDFYTVQSAAVSQIDVREWISDAYHEIKRGAKSLLGI